MEALDLDAQTKSDRGPNKRHVNEHIGPTHPAAERSEEPEVDGKAPHESLDLNKVPIQPATFVQSIYQCFFRNIKHERIRSIVPEKTVSFVGDNPSTTAIASFLALFVLAREPLFLYGVLFVVACQVIWISLKWIEYILNDPELKNACEFVGGWSSFAIRQAKRVIHYEKK